ncbi:MAG TPA: hypothetical protein VH436_09195 [Vicinamibacterales bacterium]|jgi:arylsulfatase
MDQTPATGNDIKWRHYKVHFYQQETMVSPPVKLPVPFLFNLYTNPQEDENKPALDTWTIGPVLKTARSISAADRREMTTAVRRD